MANKPKATRPDGLPDQYRRWRKKDWDRWQRDRSNCNALVQWLMQVHNQVTIVTETLCNDGPLREALGERASDVSVSLVTVVGALADAVFDAYQPSVPDFVKEIRRAEELSQAEAAGCQEEQPGRSRSRKAAP